MSQSPYITVESSLCTGARGRVTAGSLLLRHTEHFAYRTCDITDMLHIGPSPAILQGNHERHETTKLAARWCKSHQPELWTRGGVVCCRLVVCLNITTCLFSKWWWWLFPRVRGFWENVRQFIPQLRFFFLFFLKWRLARAQ